MKKIMKKQVVFAIIAMVVVGSVIGFNVIKSKASEGTGVIQQIYGELFYTVNGEVQEDFTDALDYQGTVYCIQNGKVALDYTGLFNSDSHGTIYIVKGIMEKNFTGLISNHNGTFLVENGKVGFGKDAVHGLREVNGQIHYFSGSRVSYAFTGISRLNTTRYYVVKGEICSRYTGIYTYKNVNYYIEKGIVNDKRTKVIDKAINSIGNECLAEDMTAKIYSTIGLSLPSKNWDKINSKDNKKIDKSNMRPGDMLWYGRTANYQEIGVYVGNDKMVLTSSSRSVTQFIDIEEENDYKGGNVISWIND